VSGACKRTESVAATERLGGALAASLRPGDVLAISGPLGAGKTRLVAGLVQAIVPGARVRSPSYTLVNEFPGDTPVYHLDLYRLEGARDVDGIGLEDYLARGIVVVEWGERLPGAWLDDALHITITPGEGDVRLLTASGPGPRGSELYRAWCALPERG
jgi:tRNA threonylcarbamoyl adenosine modification protein YjeE